MVGGKKSTLRSHAQDKGFMQSLATYGNVEHTEVKNNGSIVIALLGVGVTTREGRAQFEGLVFPYTTVERATALSQVV